MVVGPDRLFTEVHDHAGSYPLVAVDKAIGEFAPWADDCEVIEHLVGDHGGHALAIARLQALAERGCRAFKAKVVELKRVVRRRPVEGDLPLGNTHHRCW